MPDATSMNELRALNRLAFDELGGIPRGIGQIHHGIAQPRLLGRRPDGPPGEARPRRDVPQRLLGAGREQLTARPGGRRRDGATRASARTSPLSTTRPGSAVLAALNGLIGDELERDGSALHQPAAVRVDGEPVPLDRRVGARGGFPRPRLRGRRLPPRAHGDRVLLEPRAGREGLTYGTRLARDLGLHAGLRPLQQRPPHLRERTLARRPARAARGRLAGRGGADRARRPLDGRPGRAQRRAIRRSRDGQRWVGHVRHVISLGTPHMGAPLEQAVHCAERGAARAARDAAVRRRSCAGAARASATCARARSSTSDWRDRDPDALRAEACQEVPLLDGATHCFVSASVTRSDAPPDRRGCSATAWCWCRARRGAAAPDASRSRSSTAPHVGATHHIALLNHPEVYEHLRRWVADEDVPAVTRRARPPSRPA